MTQQQPKFFAIRGFMKSGTNWLGSLLDSHRDISVSGEFHFEHVVSRLNETLKQNSIYNMRPEVATEVRQSFYKAIRESVAAASEGSPIWIGDRTPHSIEPVTLPGSPHFCIVRDGRDVLVSRAFHLYNNPQAHRLFQRIPAMAKTWEHFKKDPWFFKNNPDQLLCHETMVRENGVFWTKQVSSNRTISQRHPKLPVCHVRYEDLHADTEGQRRRLFEFLDLDPNDCAPIEGNIKPGFDKERPDAFLRKGAIGDWKAYFTDESKQWFKETAGQEMELQGYGGDW